MKKLLYSVLGLALACGLTSCDKDDDVTYEPEIKVQASIQKGAYNVETKEEDLVVLNALEEWISNDLSNAINDDYTEQHSYVYSLSGDDLDELYQQANEKYKAEHLESDIIDAKAFVQQLQEQLETYSTSYTNFKVEIPLTFYATRLLGEDNTIYEVALDTLKLEKNDETNIKTFIPTAE